MRRNPLRRSVGTALRVCAVSVALSMALWSGSARSQGFTPEGLGTLGALLEQLGQLDTSGVRRVTAKSPVDRAREAGLGVVGGKPGPARPTREQQRAGRGSKERSAEEILIRRFCTGTLDESEEERLNLVRNFSRLERDYCRRAAESLRQYGYDLFSGEIVLGGLLNAAIKDDYVLGVGDELIITLHGQQAQVITATVDREGRVIIPNLPPIPAVGRTFGEFRRALERVAATSLLGTKVFVSLGAVRMATVMVVGEVAQPGVHQLTGLSTVLDALNVAGGIKKTGSLRRVRVLRGDRIFWVDLYELLFTTGVGQDLTLFEGDRIVVPPIGRTVAVGGQVKRPGIYELAEGRNSSTIGEALGFAGGTLRPRGNQYFHIRFDSTGRQVVVEEPNVDAAIDDGDIVIVSNREDVQFGAVELAGRVRVPGRRSLATAPTVRKLVGHAGNLDDDPYLLFAALETTDPKTRSRYFFPINLQRILEGEKDYALRDRDRLIVLGADDIRFLSSTPVQRLISERARESEEETVPTRPERGPAAKSAATGAGASRKIDELLGLATAAPAAGTPESRSAAADGLRPATGDVLGTEPCGGLRSLASVVSGSRAGRFANAIRTARVPFGLEDLGQSACPDVFDTYADLLPLALEHVVAINGEVRRPGAYPVAAGTPLSSLVAVAGGVTREADLARVEVSRFAAGDKDGDRDIIRTVYDLRKQGFDSVEVNPGDVVRFNAVFTDRDTGPVLLAGEVVRPGIYNIRRGERLSEVIERAGGLTKQAYPYGSVFTRERVKRAEQLGFRRAARELNASLAAAATRRGVDPSGVLALQRIAQQLGSVQALGRVVIEADPTVLQVRPELDTVLEPGDRIYVPKRPNFVSVIGDVLNPGAQQFVAGTKADSYIEMAGGYQQSADEDRVFVVFPNGRAQPLSVSVWNYTPVQIPPGSTIVVPKDPVPFDLFTFGREITDLISKVALTIASLAVIND